MRLRRRFTSVSLAALLILGLVASLPTFATQVFASGETIVNSSDISGFVAEPIPITNLSVNGVGNENITVTLFSLFSEDHTDTGFFSFGSANGLTFLMDYIGDEHEDESIVSVSGLRTDINAALATLTYTPQEAGTFTIQLTVGEYGTYHDASTGHAYRVIEDGVNWEQARDAAAAMTLGGEQGHLVTITSQQETNFIASWLGDSSAWLGATDLVSESDWQWATEPGGPTSFWHDGTPVNGAFTNWEDGSGGPLVDDTDINCAAVNGIDGWWLSDCGYTNAYIVEFDNVGGQAGGISTRFQATGLTPVKYVGTCQELAAVDDRDDHENIRRHYADIILTADIDCQGQPFDPLFQEDDFRGSLDGDGHTIKNVVLNEGDNYTGILSNVDWVTVTDLNLENISATSSKPVGALAGYIGDSATITDVHARNVDLTFTGNNYAGGLVGRMYADSGKPSLIENTSVTGNITVDGEGGRYIGGLVGRASVDDKFRVTKVSTDVAISRGESFEDEEYQDIGGLFGYVNTENNVTQNTDAKTTIEDAYAWGNITMGKSSNVGGLAGLLDAEDNEQDGGSQIHISRVYVKGDISGRDNVGGLVGMIDTNPNEDNDSTVLYDITSSFVFSKVTAADNEDAGAVIGKFGAEDEEFVLAYDNNEIENVYFDQSKATIDDCNNTVVVSGCAPVNTDDGHPGYFIGNSTNAPFDAWDFTTVWQANSMTPPTFRASPAVSGNPPSVVQSGTQSRTPHSTRTPGVDEYDTTSENEDIVTTAAISAAPVQQLGHENADTAQETNANSRSIVPWVVGGSSLLIILVVGYITYRRLRA